MGMIKLTQNLSCLYIEMVIVLDKQGKMKNSFSRLLNVDVDNISILCQNFSLLIYLELIC
jgi:hypothetical protein